MASPLSKRFPREFKNNLGKYLGIFLLMSVSIAMTSGFLLAAHSIETIMDEMPEKYHIEDGRFITSFEADENALESVADVAKDETGGINIYKNFAFNCSFTQPGESNTSTRTVRAYTHRTEVDLAAYAQGEIPQADNEVAIDRVFAKNNDVAVGDTVQLNGRDFVVCGIMTTADNQALFENNSDFTVNTLAFGVAELSESGFAALRQSGSQPSYIYSYAFQNDDLTLAQRTDIEKDMVKALNNEGATVEDLVDAESNQAIGYAADDVKGDSSMWITLLYIIIAIMAFVFVVLTSSTIEEESAIIGTLLASGYRRSELVAHYAALPAAVGIAAAILGNVAGYTVMSEPMQQLYYGSYSLPPYYPTWSWGVFLQTTLVPVLVMILITLIGLSRKMRHTPLDFLRHETSKGGVKRGFPLPERLGFSARFRLRVFLRNLGNFATLFIGIGFASLLLLFGLAVLPTMQHYAENLRNNVVAEHQYTLKAPLELEGTQEERDSWKAIDELQSIDNDELEDLETASDELKEAANEVAITAESITDLQNAPAMKAALEAQENYSDKLGAFNQSLDAVATDLGKTRDEALDMLESASKVDTEDENIHPINTSDNGSAIAQAEKYAVYTLEHDRGEDAGSESITIYGIPEGSRYWNDLDVSEGRVILGAGLIDKFKFADGQEIPLYDKFEDSWKTVTYTGDTWGTKSNMAIYMSLEHFNTFFGNDDSYFNAYASDQELQLDARYLASDLTPDEMDAIGNQFIGMMNDLIGMMVALSVFIFLIFMYLLTKSIIDRSARAISYMKVFGYRDPEISKLYVRSITITVAISLIVLQPIIIGGLTAIFKAMLMSYSGNIEIYVPMVCIVEAVGIGFATYLVVAFLHIRKIKKVPLALALKTQE